MLKNYRKIIFWAALWAISITLVINPQLVFWALICASAAGGVTIIVMVTQYQLHRFIGSLGIPSPRRTPESRLPLMWVLWERFGEKLPRSIKFRILSLMVG